MAERMAIGVDFGGTHARAALVNEKGAILNLRKAAHDGTQRAARHLCEECKHLLDEAEGLGGCVVGVGLGVAGKIDRRKGRVGFSPNLPALRDYPLGAELGEALGVPVLMENDANVFGVGESWVGSARGITNWIGLTLGTGVGGCLIFGGELWQGDDLGFVGEIGHINVDPGGPACACGLHGCLEAHASGTALTKGIEEAVSAGLLTAGPLYERWKQGTLTPEDVYRCTKDGDPAGRRVFDRMGWALGLVLAGLFTVLGVRHAVLGGGVSSGWDAFIGPLQSALAEYSSFLAPDDMVVMRSSLGDNAALLGAARLVWQQVGS